MSDRPIPFCNTYLLLAEIAKGPAGVDPILVKRAQYLKARWDAVYDQGEIPRPEAFNDD